MPLLSYQIKRDLLIQECREIVSVQVAANEKLNNFTQTMNAHLDTLAYHLNHKEALTKAITENKSQLHAAKESLTFHPDFRSF